MNLISERALALAWFCTSLMTTGLAASEPVEPSISSGPRDVTDQFLVPKGLQVTVWAKSPQFFNPTNIDIDARGRVWVGGVAMRINPDGTGLTVVGHNFRNSFEACLDSFGNVWQNDNDDTISCRTTWLMEGGNAGFSSADGTRSWQADKRPGQPIPIAHWRQEDPGVIPSGDVYGPGAPTGIVFYENG